MSMPAGLFIQRLFRTQGNNEDQGWTGGNSGSPAFSVKSVVLSECFGISYKLIFVSVEADEVSASRHTSTQPPFNTNFVSPRNYLVTCSACNRNQSPRDER